jgi:hypothetical protein
LLVAGSADFKVNEIPFVFFFNENLLKQIFTSI